MCLPRFWAPQSAVLTTGPSHMSTLAPSMPHWAARGEGGGGSTTAPSRPPTTNRRPSFANRRPPPAATAGAGRSAAHAACLSAGAGGASVAHRRRTVPCPEGYCQTPREGSTDPRVQVRGVGSEGASDTTRWAVTCQGAEPCSWRSPPPPPPAALSVPGTGPRGRSSPAGLRCVEHPGTHPRSSAGTPGAMCRRRLTHGARDKQGTGQGGPSVLDRVRRSAKTEAWSNTALGAFLGGKKIALRGGGGDTEAPPRLLGRRDGRGGSGRGCPTCRAGGGGGQSNIYGSK